MLAILPEPQRSVSRASALLREARDRQQGMAVTLSDVLFGSGQAVMTGSAQRTVIATAAGRLQNRHAEGVFSDALGRFVQR